MKTKYLFFLVATVVSLLVSCTSLKKSNMSEQSEYKKIQDRIRAYEWASFDAEYRGIENKQVVSEFIRGRVIVRNQPEKSACIAFLRPDNSMILITADSAVYINTDYNEIEVFHKDKSIDGYNMYALLCGNVIGNSISHWGVFSPLTYLATEIYPVSMPTVSENDSSLVMLKAKQKVKICTSAGCFFQNIPVTLFFNAETGMPDSAIDARGKYRAAEVVKNISHANQMRLLDSLFDLNSPRYSNYSVCRNDSSYINEGMQTINEELGQMELDYPLINVVTGDTVTLSGLEGWTLLRFWDKISMPTIPDSVKKLNIADNILFIMPFSDNKAFIRGISDSLNVSENTYHAKFFNQHFNTTKRFYLVSPDKKVVFSSTTYKDKINVKSLFKAKQEHEQKH